MNAHDAHPPQGWDPARYARTARFVSDLGAPVVDLLAPRNAERILDLGCGDGALTLRLLEAGAEVVGVDASAEMVAAARERGVQALVEDGERLPFESEFDAVFSNAALHWMLRPDAVIASVARALRPGGRFVAELGGHGNTAAIHAALVSAVRRRGIEPRSVDPWYFPSPDAYQRRLEAHGFAVVGLDLIPRPTRLPGAIADWVHTFCHSWLSAVAPEERGMLIDEVSDILDPCLRDEDGNWVADYVRLRFAAHLA